MKLKIHGCRGSHPCATIPDRVDEITEYIWKFAQKNPNLSWVEAKKKLNSESERWNYQIYSGNTTCLEIFTPKSPMPIFVDAGTGMNAASMDPESCLQNDLFLSGRGEAAVFMTHTHFDHVLGLTTFPQLFMEKNQFYFYGCHRNLKERVEGIFDPMYFPVPFSMVESRLHFNNIELGRSVRLGSVKVDHHPQSHPGGSFAYRFSDGSKTLVVATDTDLSNTDPPHLKPGDNVYSNASLLVLDAHFSPEDFVNKEDYGHTHIHRAVDFAVRENAAKVLLFHQSPYYTDKQIWEQEVNAREYLRKKHPGSKMEIMMSYDGQMISL
jgi:ribonuclease BN (tRNA processing enzyme)